MEERVKKTKNYKKTWDILELADLQSVRPASLQSLLGGRYNNLHSYELASAYLRVL